MNISHSQLLVSKRRMKRRVKKKLGAKSRCNHCSGAFKGSDEIETCLMCGREKDHVCSNCLFAPDEKQEKKRA